MVVSRISSELLSLTTRPALVTVSWVGNAQRHRSDVTSRSDNIRPSRVWTGLRAKRVSLDHNSPTELSAFTIAVGMPKLDAT